MVKVSELRSAIESEFTFTLRSTPIPGDLRPEWRITILLLMLLRAGRAGSMSLKKAHVLSWAVRTSETRATLIRMLCGNRRLDDVPVRFDPALNRALDFANAEKLIYVAAKSTGSILELQPTGESIALRVYKEKGCFEVEKQFFESLRGKLPEPKVQELLDWEAAYES